MGAAPSFGPAHRARPPPPAAVERGTRSPPPAVVALGGFDGELVLGGGGFDGELVLGAKNPTTRSSAAADPAWAQRIRLQEAPASSCGDNDAWMGSVGPWMGSLGLSTCFRFFLFLFDLPRRASNCLGKDPIYCDLWTEVVAMLASVNHFCPPP